MDPLRNPFSPGAGSPPPELVGRDDLIEQARIALGRIKAGRPEQSLILVGLRGVGKTVLLNRFRELAETSGYAATMIEATENRPLPHLLVPVIRKILFGLDSSAETSSKVRRGLRILRSFIGAIKLKYGDMEVGLDIDPERGTADSGELEADLGELFVALGEAARDRDAAVAVLVDEIQYLSEEELSALIMAVHRVTQRQLPVVLIGAGLPQLVGLAGRSKSYAERLFRFPEIGPLGRDDAMEAIRGPLRREHVTIQDDAIEDLIRVTRGYPYFLQEWGYQSWNLAAASPIGIDVVRRATEVSIKKLDESFFRVRFDRLTPREKDYLRALAGLGPGPKRSGDVAEQLGVKVQSIAPLRSGLIRKGMIYSPAHGDTAFTVPMFDEFMLRTMPTWGPRRSKG